MNFNQLNSFFQRAIAPVKRKVQLMLGRAILTTVQDEDIQTIQVTILAEEVQDDVQYFQHFGFRSKPVARSQAIVAAIGGNRDNLVCLGTENPKIAKTLPKLGEGESIFYAKGGTVIHVKKDGNIDIKSETKIDITSANVCFSGNVEVQGNLKVGGNSEVTGNSQVGGNSVVVGALSANAITAIASVTTPALTVAGLSFADFKQSYNSHKHPQTDDGVTEINDSQV